MAIAEITSDNGRFLPDIIAGLHYLREETWWGVPAHYNSRKPEKSNQVVDLFNAETAALVAWTIQMLGNKIDSIEPGLSMKMRSEVVRRMLIPAVEIDFDWKRRTSNWNPWICSNWLACIMLCEENAKRKDEALRQIRQALDIFYRNYPDDGGCDEGVSYWDRSAASLAECCILWEMITGEKYLQPNDPKLKAMGSYVYNMYIGNDASVNFSDAMAYPTLHPSIAYLYGRYVGDSTLCQYAAFVAKKYNFTHNPSRIFKFSGSSFPSLGREILFLRHYDEFVKVTPKEPQIESAWMPHLQIFTARSKENLKQRLYVAAKGGTNGESHNHNDIGNFVIYLNNQPAIVDMGVGTYTAQTFSRQRYELMNTRSLYHNVPLINGTEQHDGIGYRATDVSYSTDSLTSTFSLNLAEAYPSSAKVKRWQRTISFNHNDKIEFTEDFQLKKNKGNTEITLITCGQTQISGADRIDITTPAGIVAITFDSNQLYPAVEKIELQDKTLANTWKKGLYRVKLSLKSRKKQQVIRYTICNNN
ncbi:MAG: heparinase II/III family protein [Prevotella sp.]|nr:heparinase II/III family protein [Prevotella sp.]